jgi:hypothetical protein
MEGGRKETTAMCDGALCTCTVLMCPLLRGTIVAGSRLQSGRSPQVCKVPSCCPSCPHVPGCSSARHACRTAVCLKGVALKSQRSPPPMGHEVIVVVAWCLTFRRVMRRVQGAFFFPHQCSWPCTSECPPQCHRRTAMQARVGLSHKWHWTPPCKPPPQVEVWRGAG